MEKFLYTNNNEEKALYEAEVLTENLYSSLLLQDEIYLNKIINKEIDEFSSDTSYCEAAISLKENKNKTKNTQNIASSNQNNLIMLIHNKIPLTNKSESFEKDKLTSPKQIIRKNLPTSKIRLFKREKMQYDV